MKLVKKNIKHSGKTLKIKHDLSKPSNKTKVSLNSNKARKEIRWDPQITLDEGIINTLEWYKMNYQN